MKKLVLIFLHFIGRIINWRWLALISGVALIASCSGKSNNIKDNSDNANDIEGVTCYRQSVDTSEINNRYSDTALNEEMTKAKDTSVDENKVIEHK